MVRTALPLAVAFVAVPLAACSSGGTRMELAAPLPVPVAPVVVRGAAPPPPDGAAVGLSIPARLIDGAYATPNHGVPTFATAWHLRAAFNVAALNCADSAIASGYNRFLHLHRRELADAHHRVAAMHGSAFDPAMTRLYNYFAQPPVLARFCATAAPVMHQANLLPAGGLAEFAPEALAAIDRPFTDFYARYDAWRIDLANWRRGTPATPQLAYDVAGLAPPPIVTGGETRLAAR